MSIGNKLVLDAGSESASLMEMLSKLLKRYGPIILLLLFSIAVGVMNPRFVSGQNIANIAQQIVPIGIVALGAMFVIITAGIDLSAGWGVALAAVATGVVFGITESAVLAVSAALIIGFAIGFLNGAIITRLGIQPFIVTLAMMSIVQGFTYVVSHGQYIFVRHALFEFVGKQRILGLPASFLILVIVYIIGYLLLNKTKLGVYTYAIGDNEEGARLAGININKYKLLIYILSGLCMGIAALIIVARISLVTPNVGGIRILLDAITAVIIGGTSITGGRGTVQGTFLGVILVGMISNALNMLNVPPVFQDVFKGVVIIIALYFDRLTNRED